jgi:hypothetical protein
VTRSLIGALLLASAVAAPVQAQTTDPLYRSWEWVEEPSSARAAALGGAVAAAASDATSGAFSPAWLSLASETDLRLSVGWHDSGSVASDRVESGWRLTSGAVALPVGLNRGLAAYYRAPRSLPRHRLEPGSRLRSRGDGLDLAPAFQRVGDWCPKALLG